jgi:hypothetical protein
MSNLQFTVTNPDNSNAGAEFYSWELQQYLDKYNQFSAKAAGDVPVERDGWLDIINSGKIIYRGYIDSVTPEDPATEQSVGTQSIDSKCLWALLDNVFCQIYEFPALTTINAMLSSDAPVPGTVLGLLWQLNSNLPVGEAVYTGANEIYKYSNYGSLSRCGTNPIYVDTTLLTLGASATALTRGQYFRTSTDLWIRCPDGRDPKYWCVSITNYRDTRIRRGTITGGTTSFTVPYRLTAKTNFREIIERIILALNCEREMDHRAGIAGALGLTYLNVKTLVGRGSLTAPVIEFKADSVNQLNEEATGGDVFNCLLGAGPGSGYSQVNAARSNMMSRGAWREKVYTSSVLGEILTASLAKIWNDTNDPRCWTVKSEDDLSLSPGDYAGISPRKSQTLIKRVKKVTHRSSGDMNLEINQRILSAEDYMKAKASLLSDFNSFIGTQKTSWSSSFGPTNIDDSTNINAEFSGSAKFTINIPASTIDTEFATKFFLRMDIAAFEADLTTSETPAHNNGGAAGSHSGYGGTATSAKPQTAHGILVQTTSPTGGTYATVGLKAHTHLVGGRTTNGHTHGASASSTYSNSNSSRTTGYGGTPSHSHGYSDYYCSAVYTSVTVASNTDQVNGAESGPVYNDKYYDVAGYDHTHGMPAHYTQDAASQSHDTELQSSKTRTIPTEPKTANLITQFKAMKESGNSIHYLDIYVYVNNTQIAGSPFPNLYIGDEISDVDVSSLVIAGDNIIEIKIKEHYDSLIPVRCAVRGSLNASYYLDPAIL